MDAKDEISLSERTQAPLDSIALDIDRGYEDDWNLSLILFKTLLLNTLLFQ